VSQKARRALAMAGVLFLLFLLFQFLPQWLASWTESQLVGAIEQSFSSSAKVSVQLGRGSLLSWSRGQLEDLKIEARDLVTTDGFPLAAFFFEAQRLQLDLGTLVRQGKVELSSTYKARATAVLSEAGLTEYLQKNLKPLSNVRMELRGGKATLHGTALLLGQQVKLSIGGKFEPVEGELRFVPTDFFVANIGVPRFLLTALSREVEFTIPLGKLPLPLELESVRIEEGRAYLSGRGDLE